MFGFDELLDESSHWINVQDPIKQMFLAMTKAIRAQSAGYDVIVITTLPLLHCLKVFIVVFIIYKLINPLHLTLNFSGIRDLDRKLSNLSNENKEMNMKLLREGLDAYCTKSDATQIIYQIDSKANNKDVVLLEKKLEKVAIDFDNFR